MTESDIRIINHMARYGGSFVKALAEAARHADSDNLARIQRAFPEIWGNYERLVEAAPDAPKEPKQ